MSVLSMVGLVPGNTWVPRDDVMKAVVVEDTSFVGKDHFQPNIASDAILT